MDGNDDTGRMMRIASYASVAMAVTMVLAKLGAWSLTDSVALLSSLVDSILDVATSLINVLAIHQALQPADAAHRFGHGKAEPLAGLGQAAFIAGSGLFLVIEAGNRLFHPAAIDNSRIGIAVMAVSIVLTLALVRFQNYVVKRTRSVAISADALHYTGDILINGGVIVALVCVTQLHWTLVDPVIGVGIAGYLLFNSWQLAVSSLHLLMDREFDDQEREQIRAIVLSHPGALSLHDLRTRSSGPQRFIQLHLELDRNMPLWQAHDIADHVELKLREAFPEAEVIIHQDPAGLVEDHPEFSFEDTTAPVEKVGPGAVPITGARR
ncbi:MAG: cation diffusion facilitator family transporter [Alphaproteobacteria bacterium]|nr:cation diffusion facilitator family transporter [Alphaproteobacteria bacterium]